MYRLVRLMAVAILSFLTQINSSQVSAAQDNENPLTRLGFNLCDGRPCFLGIIPGVTDWQDASSVLLAKGFELDNLGPPGLDTLSNVGNSGDGITVFSDPTKPNTVRWIELAVLHGRYTIHLADVLALYGLPCAAASDAKNSYWFSYHTVLAHALSDERSDAGAPIIYIAIVNPVSGASVSGVTICDKVEYSPEYLRWFTF